MDNADPTAVIILSEIIFFETLIIIGYAIMLFIKKKKNIKELSTIVSAYEKELPNREESLKSIYGNTPNITDNEIKNIVEHETKYFRTIIDMLDKKNSAYQNIAKDIHTLVSPYAQLMEAGNKKEKSTDEETTNSPDIDSAIDDLLADEADDADGDPALDLSDSVENDGEIEEIPEGLLADSDMPNQDTGDQDETITENEPKK